MVNTWEYWKKSAKEASNVYEGFLCLEQAYNHIENAYYAIKQKLNDVSNIQATETTQCLHCGDFIPINTTCQEIADFMLGKLSLHDLTKGAYDYIALCQENVCFECFTNIT